MSLKTMAVALGGLTLMASLGGAAPAPMPAVAPAAVAAAAVAAQQYYPSYPGVYCYPGGYCWPIIYAHDVYSDAEHTNWIGGGTDTCTESMGMVFRNEPWLPAGYEVKTPLYLCAPGGPYMIPDS